MTESTPSAGAPAPAAVQPGALTWTLGLGAAGTIAYLFRSLTLPLILAALVAYLLNPATAWAQGFAIRRSVAVTALFGGIGVALVLFGIFVVPRFRAEGLALVANLPEVTGYLEQAIDGASRELGTAYPQLRRRLPADETPGWLGRYLEARLGGAGDIAAHAGAVGFVVVLAPIFAFFLLRDGGRMVGALLDRLHPVHIETTVAVWCEIDRIIGRYLRGLALEGIAVGVLAGLGLWVVGVPYPLLLGAFTGLVNPLPYLGTVLSVSAASAVALAHGQGLGTVGFVLGLYAVIRILDDLVIVVITIGKSVHLHPVLVIASIVAGEHAFGLIGMVLAVPVVTVLKEIARLLLEHRRTLAGPRVAGSARAGAPVPYVC